MTHRSLDQQTKILKRQVAILTAIVIVLFAFGVITQSKSDAIRDRERMSHRKAIEGQAVRIEAFEAFKREVEEKTRGRWHRHEEQMLRNKQAKAWEYLRQHHSDMPMWPQLPRQRSTDR